MISRRARFESIALVAVVIALAMWRFGATTADPDLWGHVKFGVEKVTSGFRLHGDHYSYLGEGTPWFDPQWAGQVVFNHEWLGEVVMGAVYMWLGPPGLAVLKALLAASVVGFYCWWLLREGMSPLRMALVMVPMVLLLTPTLGTLRPQIFTLVLMTVMLVVMVGYTRSPRRVVWWLPVLFVAWVNLHGGFLSGIAVVGVWSLVYAVTRRRHRLWWEPMAVVGVASAALVLNPNGIGHLRFLIETTTIPRPEIVEWVPLQIASLLGVVYVAMVALVVVGMIRLRDRIDLSLVLPLIGLMAAPLLASRHLQLFVPGVVVLGAPYLTATLGVIGSEQRSASSVTSVAFLVVALVAGGFSVVRVADASSCLAIDAAQFPFPARGVAALVDAGAEGNAVVPFNWGQFIIWHLGPEMKVSGDGRRETVYSPEVHQANIDFANGEGDWARILEVAPADLIIQVTGTPGAQLVLTDPDWELAYQDEQVTVIARPDDQVSLSGDDRIPADGQGLCFPANGS